MGLISNYPTPQTFYTPLPTLTSLLKTYPCQGGWEVWGDGEMGEIFIKRCSAVLGVSPMSDCIKTG
ncbi:hypothetical protein [Moorena sp. SIO4G3]|uniref:hypothetical protein n=1 Tax=Moorena sp. SIO4G3 TaxID=2607821 RepID=UPI00142BE497|nr:hypothetical protein [Moorena sp. SIO4G3]NEO78859.1 hypothetical protein [Moorena sp. SIO4G3]